MKFNLSEKIIHFFNKGTYLPTQDVKEFIRLEEELLNQLNLRFITWNEFIDKRERLAGDDLK